MELDFLLPFVDELKRLSNADNKTTIRTALDRFYSSDLFDRNVLNIIGSFGSMHRKILYCASFLKEIEFTYRHRTMILCFNPKKPDITKVSTRTQNNTFDFEYRYEWANSRSIGSGVGLSSFKKTISNYTTKEEAEFLTKFYGMCLKWLD